MFTLLVKNEIFKSTRSVNVEIIKWEFEPLLSLWARHRRFKSIEWSLILVRLLRSIVVDIIDVLILKHNRIIWRILNNHWISKLKIRIQHLFKLLNSFRVDLARLFLSLKFKSEEYLNMNFDFFCKAINSSMLMSSSLITWITIEFFNIIKHVHNS